MAPIVDRTPFTPLMAVIMAVNMAEAPATVSIDPLFKPDIPETVDAVAAAGSKDLSVALMIVADACCEPTLKVTVPLPPSEPSRTLKPFH